MNLSAALLSLPAQLFAFAADIPPRRAPPPVAPVAYAPPVYHWSGFYVGGNLGAGFAHSSWSDPFTGGHDTFDKTGFIGGGQVGVNWQINALVLGIEGDFDWTGLKGSGHDSRGNTINTDTQWTSTVTGRIGAAFDRLLVYGKGGVAFAHVNEGLNDIFGGAASTSQSRTGWTAGVGLEYAFAQNWSARIEYDASVQRRSISQPRTSRSTTAMHRSTSRKSKPESISRLDLDYDASDEMVISE